ncbi:uncharacterized protein MYCFIDRAFT_153732 [Pseudocercospora fijiensis CIRAD86]|uniref:PAS domain-containing protein n=1 Tax=Pseudocercospora fijiensis (strain CIRAD86) TaxID=383855 RepID=M3B0U7_PSEFD|nr:uncharacterized protein MYCFIDRAFT_153732 [Pseudocercospora fijiensis CIRAD86]EME83062.1 hypothetical protein MYCFIDRAFT_153732 [Pseudocercospora fijiensis CIRAD86]
MPRASESPISRHAGSGNHKPYQPQLHTTSHHTGRSGPPTPADSNGKEHSLDQFPRPPQTRMLSPPGSVASYSIGVPTTLGQHALAQLQTPSADRSDVLETELDTVDDPESWNVIKPNIRTEEQWDNELYSLEKRAQQLYSAEHLHILLEDTDFHSKFSTFLRRYRPWRLPILVYYWDACKAIRALNYANSLAQSLSSGGGYEGCPQPPGSAANAQLQHAATHAFQELLGDDLHWYIALTYIGIVGAVMQSRIMNTLPAPLRETSQGLAEVFCITDPTRRDNPIILASPAFTRHSGCPMDYILGRNCRFMQGPGTTIDSCRRFAISIEKGEDHSEIFVNYRRDGSPFLSLVMNAHLIDSRGKLRYFLGAQVDVSGLLKNCSGLDSLTRLVERQRQKEEESGPARSDSADPIKPLSEMLNGRELNTISKFGGVLQRRADHKLQAETSPSKAMGPGRVLLADEDLEREEQVVEEKEDESTIPAELPLTELNLRGVYKYYLLVRPYPSLRVLFASPTLRVPGVLQSQFLHRIGGTRMRQDLHAALQDAKVVTAKVRWLRSLSEDGESGESTIRWIHCTPLMHHTGNVGLWMVVVVVPQGGENVASQSSRVASRLASRSDDDGIVRGRQRISARHGPM